MTKRNIVLIGYGKMGKTIEELALAQGHSIAAIIDVDTNQSIEDLPPDSDVAIEFTRPESAFANISACLNQGVPVVSGTTGWLEQMDAIREQCNRVNGAFFYASNYSLGVNLFFLLNEFLARQMNNFTDYEVGIHEVHHTQKLDAPSGTAITLAEGIIQASNQVNSWSKGADHQPNQIPITSERVDAVPGTHVVTYASEIDSIEIKHTAHTRKGFAQGALTAALWLTGRQGCFGMRDLLGF